MITTLKSCKNQYLRYYTNNHSYTVLNNEYVLLTDLFPDNTIKEFLNTTVKNIKTSPELRFIDVVTVGVKEFIYLRGTYMNIKLLLPLVADSSPQKYDDILELQKAIDKKIKLDNNLKLKKPKNTCSIDDKIFFITLINFIILGFVFSNFVLLLRM